jgi:hypothetical protein
MLGVHITLSLSLFLFPSSLSLYSRTRMDGAAEAAGREQRGTPSMRRQRRTSATALRWDLAGRAFLGGGGDEGKVRVLAIDGCGPGPGDALLAVAALVRL